MPAKKRTSASRTSIFLKNFIISICSQLLILVLSFINRRVFVLYMDVELLGYDNLFANIFNILSVTELGVGGIITFHLYREFANKNTDEIAKLMHLYRNIYRIVAIAVLTLGMIIYFFLPFIVKDETYNWTFIHEIYLIQLAGTVAGYLFSYMRTIFIADQQEYRTIEADLVTQVYTQILQIVVIVFLKNFIIYIAIKTAATILSNILISFIAIRKYPYLKYKNISITDKDIKKWNIVSDVKNFLIHKIAYSVYGGTDSVVISAICGIKNVALYGNYYLIQNSINNIFINRVLNPIQASVGNYVYSEDCQEKQKETFMMLDTFCILLASYVMAGYMLFYQPFITFWLGKQYLLDYAFVFAFSITSYLSISCEMLYKYRATFGEYEKDRNCMIFSAIINVIVSIVLAKVNGMLGVQIGTIFGLLPIIFGRMRLVIGEKLEMSMLNYILVHFKCFLLEIVECIIMLYLSKHFGDGIPNIVARIFLFLAVPTFCNYIYFKNNKDYILAIKYIMNIKSSIIRYLFKNKPFINNHNN